MNAFVLDSARSMKLSKVPYPMPRSGEVVVRLTASALNHRDLWIYRGQYPGIKFPTIAGSDGAGVVESLGEGVENSWLGREVILNPGLRWGPDETVQSGAFNILGLPSDGTFAQKVRVPVSQLSSKPAHLSWEEAAALPLSGLTAYRALVSRGGLKKGEKVLITGIGGGVALFALQFAVALGAETWVSSSSQEKIDRAVKLGAKGGFLYTEKDWPTTAQSLTGGFDVILDGAAGEGVDALFDAAAPGARIVAYGATRGDIPNLVIRKLFLKQLSYLGSMMGSPHDWAQMIALVASHGIRPVISEQFPLSRVHDAIALMERGSQFGKIVFNNLD